VPCKPLDIRKVVEQTFVARAEHHATLGSTNSRARDCAAAPGELPLLIVADAQTAGRGRGANRWWTGRGSLALSLLLDPGALKIDRTGSPLLALGAAVATAEAISPWLPGRRVGIHWPNDVMVGRRKLAGILVEALSGGLCVVGIGLNLNNSLEDAPAELRATAATIRQLTGSAHDPTELLVSLLDRLAEGFDQLAADPSRLAGRADALCLQHGQTLTVQTGSRRVTGRSAGIAPDGALLLDTPSGRQTIHSGSL